MTINEKVGKAIINLRQERNISQEHLALEAGVSPRYMSDIENGKRNPSVDILERIAKYFCISISALMAKAEAVGVPQPTLDEIKQWLCDQGNEESIVFENPDYVSAIIGVSEDGRVIYDYNLMIESLMQSDNMTYDEASEFIDYNTIRALPYMGEKAPIVMYSKED
jgi:transcriptional regulator with XRE-family HTH domain